MYRSIAQLGWLIAAVGLVGARSPNFIQLVNDGIRFWQDGQPYEAIKVLEEALKESPDDPDANNMLGLAMFDIGNYDVAEKSYKTALRVNSRYDLAHYNYALVLEARGEDQAAAEHYEQAIQHQRYIKVDDATNNLANVYLRLGQTAKAKTLLEEVVYQRQNYQHLATVSLSDIKIEEGDYEAAYDLLAKHGKDVFSESTGKVTLGSHKRMSDLVEQHLMPGDSFQVLKSKAFMDGYLEAIQAMLSQVIESFDDQDKVTRTVEIIDVNSFGVLPLLAHDIAARILKGKAAQKGVKFDIVAITSNWAAQHGVVEEMLQGLDITVEQCNLRYRSESCNRLTRSRKADHSAVVMTGVYTNSQAPSAFQLLSSCVQSLERSGLDPKQIHVIPSSAKLNLLLIENDQVRKQGSVPNDAVLGYNITDFSRFLKKNMWKISRPYYISRLQEEITPIGHRQEIEIFNTKKFGSNWSQQDRLKGFVGHVQAQRNGRVDGVVTWYDLHVAGSVHLELLSPSDKQLFEKLGVGTDPPAAPNSSLEREECTEHSVEECSSLSSSSKSSFYFPCRLTVQYIFGYDSEILVQGSSQVTTACAGVHMANALFYIRTESGSESVYSLDPSGFQIDDLDGNIWHVDMINDDNRNKAYLAAIEKAVQPKKSVVLDLGTGSGLLAFMAASAGSPKVFACEQNELIASAAEKTASSLGLESTVKIFSKKSQSLIYPDEVDSEVDIFVTETMGNDLLGELMKDLVQDANTRLGKDSSVVIPSAGRIWAQAIQVQSWQDIPLVCSDSAESSAGMDRLQLLNTLRSMWPLEVNVNVMLDLQGNPALKNLSDPFVVAQFDFVNQQVQPNGMALEVDIEVTTSGMFHAVLFWWEVLLYPGVTLDTGPGSPYASMQESHWKQHLQVISTDGEAVNERELLTIAFYNDNHFSYFELLS